jgi:PPOX class probable F420-dependent enzyme
VTPEQREFLEQHRLVVVGLPGKGAPVLTPVYYAMDGDDIVISTTASRYKAKAVRRNPQVALCVLGEQQPFPYVTVHGHGTIEDTGAADVMMKVGERMTGNPIPEAARPAVEQRAKDEGRVVLRVRIERFGGSQFSRPATA